MCVGAWLFKSYYDKEKGGADATTSLGMAPNGLNFFTSSAAGGGGWRPSCLV
jgi:hypothetical protein